MAARLRVIVLEQADARTFRYALWADVPVARQAFYARPGAVSAWKDALPTDNDALAAGQVVERIDQIGFPPGTNLAAAQAALQTQWQSFQDEITALNRWARFGTTWDGATWTSGGVA